MNSLTLSPALCAILLKERHEHRDPLSTVINFFLGWFFKLFNKAFTFSIDGYTRLVGKLLRVSVLVLLVYAGLLYLTVWSFGKMPTGFIPNQDQGFLLVVVQLPDSASLERTEEVMARADKIAHEHSRASGMRSVSAACRSCSAPTDRTWALCSWFSIRSMSGGRPICVPTPSPKTSKRLYNEIEDATLAVFGAAARFEDWEHRRVQNHD